MSILEVTMYLLPDGRQLRTLIENVTREDAAYFQENDILVSMEQLTTGEFAVYGRRPDADEDDEVLVLANGRNCKDTLHELRRIMEGAA